MKTSMVILYVLVSLSLVFSLVSVVTLFENNIGLGTKVQALQGEVDSLKSNIERMQQPNLVTSLNVYDVNGSLSAYSFQHYLVISGPVTNVGLTTAFNAGLHVVAKDEADNIVIDMTVPIVAGSYGWSGAYNQGPNTLNTLLSQETLNADLMLYHGNSNVKNWTITPVYTTQP